MENIVALTPTNIQFPASLNYLGRNLTLWGESEGNLELTLVDTQSKRFRNDTTAFVVTSCVRAYVCVRFAHPHTLDPGHFIPKQYNKQVWEFRQSKRHFRKTDGGYIPVGNPMTSRHVEVCVDKCILCNSAY